MSTHLAIEDHALIGNTATGALVDRSGTINWLCLPRFDAPAVFAGILGTREHGTWRVCPTGAGPADVATDRSYLGESLTVRHRWVTAEGAIDVTDFMPASDDDGTISAQVIRIVEGITGAVEMTSQLLPRPGYGAEIPQLALMPSAGATQVSAQAGNGDIYWLEGPVEHTLRDGSACSTFTITEGQRIAFVLSHQSAGSPRPLSQDPYTACISASRYWQLWADQCTYRGPYRALVIRTLLTLRAMCHPGGGIVAAPTTSLPEALGEARNWDYRFTWLRDASMTVSTLVRYGYLQEARNWIGWLLRTVGDDPENLQIMYGLGGERDLKEAELDWLPGYADSRPVRLGNAAADQLQLDVYGELAIALLDVRRAGVAATPEVDRLVITLGDQLEHRWNREDEGLWEVRGPRRHFVHSKVMCWVFYDRAISLLQHRSGDQAARLERWGRLREEIHADVLARGFDEQRNTFTQFYGGRELDAALLLLPQVGFLPPDDKRIIGTVEAVQRELSTPGGFVLRYPTHSTPDENVDGLTGHEGAFLTCSYWLCDALVLIGRRDEATELFERLRATSNDLGLSAEEWDPRAKRQLGNFPQALTHLAQADTAWRLEAARLQLAYRAAGGLAFPASALPHQQQTRELDLAAEV
ncbi:glycoside hydrolase family 15 protein [Streptacidiphilus jiangxiensis]|uniref:Trehalase n=1 Tax=Streptacidiphilus jiangxiensis TaxID=235985 RepID=A0A1H8BN26_STRJI|nr:glycoside hydrolase family 15 protein [Streptacidiphilus jiangxiensis]SEM84172.1 Glucoamylase (glucan-1,4-alpha-glucosidase), GH15 family [Streptacidiphilus jiangxiensis]